MIWNRASEERFQAISKMFYRDSSAGTECPKCLIFLPIIKADLSTTAEMQSAADIGKSDATSSGRLNVMTGIDIIALVARDIFTIDAKVTRLENSDTSSGKGSGFV
jgi:hypothetical protein